MNWNQPCPLELLLYQAAFAYANCAIGYHALHGRPSPFLGLR